MGCAPPPIIWRLGLASPCGSLHSLVFGGSNARLKAVRVGPRGGSNFGAPRLMRGKMHALRRADRFCGKYGTGLVHAWVGQIVTFFAYRPPSRPLGSLTVTPTLPSPGGSLTRLWAALGSPSGRVPVAQA